MKFTFKTEKPTGTYSSFESPNHYIKFNKKVVGSIGDAVPHKIRLQVIKKDISEDGCLNCKWKWVTLKKESKSLDEAKLFLNDNIDKILNLYTLKLED